MLIFALENVLYWWWEVYIFKTVKRNQKGSNTSLAWRGDINYVFQRENQHVIRSMILSNQSKCTFVWQTWQNGSVSVFIVNANVELFNAKQIDNQWSKELWIRTISTIQIMCSISNTNKVDTLYIHRTISKYVRINNKYWHPSILLRLPNECTFWLVT
jgi:hypothetical protein